MPIGKIIVDLEAQYAAFNRGVSEMKHGITDIGESLESLKGIAETAFAFAGVEMGVSAIKEMIGNTMEQTAQAYRLSSALGITTSSLQELQTAGLLGAGVKAEEFDGIMQKLTKSLAGAEDDGGKAAAALTSLGLSGDALKGARVDEAFIKIAQEISKVQDPAKRAGDEIALLGRSGQALDPLLQQGAAGIAKFAEEAQRMGTAMSDTDAAKIMQANEAYEKMGLAVQGAENQLTIALAPAIDAVISKINSLVPSASTMQSAFISAFRYVAEGIGFLIDTWHGLQLVGEGASWGIVTGIETVIATVDALANAVVWVADKLGADWHVPDFIKTTEDTVDQWRQQIQSDMASTVDQLASPESAKWGQFFDQIQSDAAKTAADLASHKPMQALAGDFEENGKKIETILQGLQKQIDEFGLTEAQKKIKELQDLHANPADIATAEADAKKLDALNEQKKVQEEIAKLQVDAAQAGMTSAEKQVDDLKRNHASDDQIATATNLQTQIDQMAAWRKEQEEANKLIEQSQTPIEKYQQQIDKVQKLFADGLITAQQQSDAIAKASKELGKADGGDEIKKAQLETRRFDFRLPTTPQKEDAGAQALAVAQQHLREAQDQSFWQNQLYLFGLQDQQNQDTVVDLV